MAAAATFTNEEAARLMKMVWRFIQVLPNVSIDWEWVKQNGKFGNYTTGQIEEKYKSMCHECETEDDAEVERNVQLMAKEFAEKNKGKPIVEEEEIEKIRQIALKVSLATLFHEDFANYIGYFENSTIGRTFDVYIRLLTESLKRIPGRVVQGELIWPNDGSTWEFDHWQAIEDIEKLKQEEKESSTQSSCIQNENEVHVKKEEQIGGVVSEHVAGPSSKLLQPVEEGLVGLVKREKTELVVAAFSATSANTKTSANDGDGALDKPLANEGNRTCDDQQLGTTVSSLNVIATNEPNPDA